MEEAGLLIDRNFRAISGFDESPTDHQSITNKQRPQISTLNGSGGNDYINFTENPAAIGMTAFQPQPPMMNATVDVFNVQHNMELLSYPKQPPPLRSPPPDMFHSFLAVNQKHEPGSSSTSYNPLSQDFSGRYDGQSPSDMTFHPQNLISDQPRPNRHGLSLSLSPHNPSELRVQAFQSSSADELAYGLGYCNIGGNKPSSSSSSPCFRPYELKNSKYLIAAQELLYEFCNLGTKQTRNHQKKGKKSTTDDCSAPSIYTSDVVELQKRKCKLISMLEEVDRRHKIYREQMRTVVSSFESVAGEGSADIYSSLAAKAMSKHFRCLRDAIVAQLSSTRKALGERDTPAPGTTKGETPRLRILDQCIRQQRALQNMGVLENHPWRPQRGLPERAVSVLRAWLFEHFLHPYPSDVDKHILARQTGLSRSQVSNWFINARVRLWKPMVEEMYTEEQKEHEKGEGSNQDKERNPNPNSHLRDHVQHNPDSLSTDNLKMKATAVAAALGGYSHHGRTSYDFSEGGEVTLASQRQYNENRGSVSLTLGLHQQSLNLNQYNQHSLFFPRDAGHHHHQLEDVQYSFMDGGTDVQDGSSSYNNGGHHLVGGQLLHDFVG